MLQLIYFLIPDGRIIIDVPVFVFNRFEPDMLAFSGCYYGGGDKERKDLAKIRRRWKTLHVSFTATLRGIIFQHLNEGCNNCADRHTDTHTTLEKGSYLFQGNSMGASSSSTRATPMIIFY